MTEGGQVKPIPVFFNEVQLEFKPLYEWAFGNKISHPETTARAESILAALQGCPKEFAVKEPREIPLSSLRKLHSYNLITLYNTASQLNEDQTFYPSVFPKSRDTDADPTRIDHAGYFCFDSGTPLSANTWQAAAWSAASARAAAAAVRSGKAGLTYALSRPPGHHATRDVFGGYCYFNNAGIAARHFRAKGRVVVLDVDFHHGNGTQALFYRDPRVLTISIHGDPRTCYPYYWGYGSEKGAGRGEGFNLNVPLPKGTTYGEWLAAAHQHVIPAIQHFDPAFLVLAAGLDAYKKDPVGHFRFETDDFYRMGEEVGRLKLPTAVIQEGGYYTAHLGRNAKALLLGIREGMAG